MNIELKMSYCSVHLETSLNQVHLLSETTEFSSFSFLTRTLPFLINSVLKSHVEEQDATHWGRGGCHVAPSQTEQDGEGDCKRGRLSWVWEPKQFGKRCTSSQ